MSVQWPEPCLRLWRGLTTCGKSPVDQTRQLFHPYSQGGAHCNAPIHGSACAWVLHVRGLPWLVSIDVQVARAAFRWVTRGTRSWLWQATVSLMREIPVCTKITTSHRSSAPNTVARTLLGYRTGPGDLSLVFRTTKGLSLGRKLFVLMFVQKLGSLTCTLTPLLDQNICQRHRIVCRVFQRILISGGLPLSL